MRCPPLRKGWRQDHGPTNVAAMVKKTVINVYVYVYVASLTNHTALKVVNRPGEVGVFPQTRL